MRVFVVFKLCFNILNAGSLGRHFAFLNVEIVMSKVKLGVPILKFEMVIQMFNVLLDNSTFCARRGISQILAKTTQNVNFEILKENKYKTNNRYQHVVFELVGRIQNITATC